MVKMEGYDDHGGSSDLDFKVQSVEKVSQASSSCSELRLNLIGMGFSSNLVDKAIEEHGMDNIDVLLEALLTLSAMESLEPEPTNSQDDASIMNGIIDSATDESLDIVQELKGTTVEVPFKFVTCQLLEMGFSEEEISMAIDTFGLETPISELADSIFAKRMAYDDKEILQDASSNTDRENSYDKSESVSVINVRGLQGNAPAMPFAGEMKRSSRDANLNKPELFRKMKKGKSISKPGESSYGKQNKEGGICPRKAPIDMPKCYNILPFKKKCYNIPDSAAESALSNTKTIGTVRSLETENHRQYQSQPPYFLYGNVIDIPEEDWKKLSRFLSDIEPEYVNSKLFSALTRKEGFLHNLPTENRLHTLPGSPMTIQEALPFTGRWWPSWDTRKKLHGITNDTIDIGLTCERIGKIMMTSRGILTPEQKVDILHQCKALNLLWAGEHLLVTLEPENAERILGYPVQHTQVAGLKDMERLNALKHAFQTKLLGYLLSPLKPRYPEGLRVLSVFSGIGGAEVALSKLGIRLKCVVSIEASEINRQILRRWWDRTKQSGYLGQLRSIEELSRQRIRSLVAEFGGFDLIIAGNPYTFNKLHGDSSAGVNFTLYFEFVRLFQSVRGIMSLNK